MGFLRKLLKYKNICIQCHNNPDGDAIASSFGVASYLRANGVNVTMVYGGAQLIQKSALKIMLKECGIDITHADAAPEDAELLLNLDCQFGNSNVAPFEAKERAVIDHHIRTVEENDMYLIINHQSCSTVVYELLKEENFPIDDKLAVALLYGLYTDTSLYNDLFSAVDTNMRLELYHGQPLFDRLAKSTMSVAELLIAGDALLNHYLDIDRRFAIVEALKCDQTLLGAIGDIIICVDVVSMSLVYCEKEDGYQISLRSSHEKIKVNEVAKFVCDGIGGGGGHANKAGGFISKEKMNGKYGDMKIFDVIEMLLAKYIDTYVSQQ